MFIIGIDSINRGTSNQLRGLIVQTQLSETNFHNAFMPIDSLLWSGEDGKFLLPRYFDNSEQLSKALYMRTKSYLSKNLPAPDVVLLPFDQSLGEKENIEVDLLAKLLKENFERFGIKIKTLVLASNFYNYKYADFIHIGAHQLSLADEQTMLNDKELSERIILTLGVPSDLTKMQIKLATHHTQELRKVLEKYSNCRTVLYSLGGKTADDVIKFSLRDAQNILDSADCFAEHGYKIIITNSQRTPNDVTDYLYQKCDKKENIVFYNCKNIAASADEKQNFRYYSGNYETEFAQMLEKYGNIYPAVLDVCDFVVNTHDSFSYTSDVAALGIASVVYTGNEIGSARPDCHKLFKLCHEAGHSISLDEAVQKVKSGQKIETLPLIKVSKQIVNALKTKINC